ncbi:MAG TPA: diacylglycerol kinase family protein [Candidatus Saccharimonadales bacterium]|nr:diacylglycerol kinase family protein [Candidatus Saccharimonadales bacterium]
MNVILIYNAKAGSTLPKQELRALFSRHDIRIIALIDAHENLREHLRPYIRDRITVAVFGGDGTLSMVAACLAGTEAILAPLPGGTLNHFTKDLHIPPDLEEAITHLKRARVAHVDVGSINGRSFINNVSIGLYPVSLIARDRLERRIGKPLAVFIAACKAFFIFRLYTVTIGDEVFRTPFVFIGNNDYKIDHVGIAERQRLDEGVLSVLIAKTTSRWVLAKITFLLFLGKASVLDEFDTRTVPSLTISMAKKTMHIACDGELLVTNSPLRFKILPKALKVRK